jgi:protein-S-isoprenylcysteine O-methyltransferase Ste14
MLISSFVGAKTGKHNIRDILYTGETQKPVSSALWFLILEVGAMALLNGAGPLISAKLQGDHVQGPKKWIMPGIIAGTAVLLHIMIQWVGLWDSFTHMRGGVSHSHHVKVKEV